MYLSSILPETADVADADLTNSQLCQGGSTKSHTPIVLAAKEHQDFQASWLHVTRRLHDGRQESPSTPSKHDCRRWRRQQGLQDFQDFQALSVIQEGMETMLLEAMSVAVLSHFILIPFHC